MPQVQYQVVSLDLTIVRNRQPIDQVPVGSAFNAVTVLSLPAGGTISLSFGDNLMDIPLFIQGQAFNFITEENCPLFNDAGKLLVTNPAGAGIVQLLVSLRPKP